MIKTLIASLSLLVLGCSRKTEALPLVQSNVQPAQESKPKESFNGEQKATAPTVNSALATQAKEPNKEPDKREPVSVPKDKASKLVDNLLRPADKSLVDELSKKRLSGPAFMERPEITLPKYKGLPPKLAVKDSGKPVRPKPAAEGTPLSRFFGDPQLPVVVKLEGTALVKWPMPDPNQPVPLPILAQPKSERAPLTDPTADASTDAALAGTIPMRETQAPFLRINLPNPFENRQTIRVRNPLPEDSTPQTR